jgi:outer membrane protein
MVATVQKTSSRVWQFATNLLLLAGLGLALGGCVSDKVPDDTLVTRYQRTLARQGPQQRQSMEGENPAEALGVLEPVAPAEGGLPELAVTVDPNTGQKTVKLTLEEAITRTLANSPEIRVVSFDPEIARQEIAKAAGAFDPVIFNQDSWDDQDSPKNSTLYDVGRADRRLFESGVRQRTPLGSEWSASYAFARNWDDVWGRTLPTRYEPMLIFQLKQSLLRDGWWEVNLAGVNIARLGHQIALVGFRDKAESLAAAVIATYWRLVQARRDLEIQQQLVDETLQALHKVEGRREIDATDVQLMQVRAYAKLRQADLALIRKQVKDTQDALAGLLASPEINTTSTVTIVPVTAPEFPAQPPEAATLVDQALATAMQYNPAMQEARMRIRIAEINVKVAENQRLPRLDLTGSARAQSLAATSEEAHEQLEDRQYTSYSIGLSFEQPLGNRERKAELNRRRIELHKAVAVLHTAADQIAVQVKDRARKAQTTLEQVTLQKEAAQAAANQLKALKESEPVRDKLTPEFMLVKLQAQEIYAQTQHAEIEALTQFNVSLAELARTTGTVLQLHQVEGALTAVSPPEPQPEPEPEAQVYGPQEREREVPELLPAGILYSRPAKLK